MAIVALLTLIQWQHAKTQQRMGQRLQEAGIETGLHYPCLFICKKA
jgi:hypothetical protein